MTGPTARGRISLARGLDLGLAGFGVLTVVLMWRNPDWGTVPYHLLFLMTMLVYGYRVWSIPVTAAVVTAIVVVTGALMIGDYRDGEIEGAELSEILLMPALLAAMAWHARRRVAAMKRLQEMASVQQAMLERERNFFRDTSHAIRTPVTIARGHLELALEAAPNDMVAEDLDVAISQMDRMAVLSSRLLALAQLDAGEAIPSERVELTGFIEQVGRAWTANSSRVWSVVCEDGGAVEADPVWLDLAVDALVENAVHFTAEGGRIEICGRVGPRTCSITVSDDGVGIPPDDLELVFERFWHRLPPNGPMGSGLGLAMTRATAGAWGGHVHAQNNADGGAFFAIVLPRATTVD